MEVVVEVILEAELAVEEVEGPVLVEVKLLVDLLVAVVKGKAPAAVVGKHGGQVGHLLLRLEEGMQVKGVVHLGLVEETNLQVRQEQGLMNCSRATEQTRWKDLVGLHWVVELE